ncbi:MAG: mechanosensitive ion channel [Pseudoxanthomonas suwonensis]|nr:mechanosensitive ion channel [Pseudoxanthomonas suwonensis]
MTGGDAPIREAQDAAERVRVAAGDAVERGWDGLQPLLDQRLLEFGGVTLTVGGVIAAVLIVPVALLLSSLARRMITRFGERHERADTAALYTVSRIVHYLLLALAVMLALEALGLPLSRFTIFAGALGVGLGFGLQQIFNNFMSGLILLFDRSLKVGDFVQLDDNVRGVVKAINIRSTRITTNDNIDILVPNSEFVSGRVTNWTYRSVNRRIRVPFGVAYGVDKELVKKAALEAASKVPFTLSMDGQRAPQVWLVEFGDNSVQFILAVWLTEAAARRNTAVRAAYMWELDSVFRKYAIELALPQRELHLRGLFGLQGAAALAAFQGRDGAAQLPDDAEAVMELSDEERARFARNDARADAEREIAADPLAQQHTQALPEENEHGAD